MVEGQVSSPSNWASSFRDPAGRLLTVGERVLRFIQHSGVQDLQAFLSSATGRKLIEAGRLVGTRKLDNGEIQELSKEPGFRLRYDPAEIGMVLEHERVPFPTFPFEWPPEMLHAAGCLTLDLAEGLLAEGLGLKDATPYNVLFCGPNPIFVDVLSAERRDSTDPTWLPYAQFLRTFLLPLLVNKYFGIPLEQILTTRRDGIEPEEVYRFCGLLQKLRPPMLTLVTIPAWLGRWADSAGAKIYQKKSAGRAEKAQFILQSLFAQMRRTLDRVAPAEESSPWSNYMATKDHYSPESFQMKRAFVETAMAEFHPRRVLDIGCNTGYFSAIVARAGASVVAVDSDPAVVGQAWRMARGEALNILPMVVNIARPTPAIGWRNQECPAFLDRAHGAFDVVFLLAVIHHMMVNERIPLSEILDLAAELTTRFLVIEFISPEDPMFRLISRGRDDLFRGLTLDTFEAACRGRFQVLRSQRLSQSSRWLYLLSKTR